MDAAVPSDGLRLADAVAEQVRAAGRPVARVRSADFLRPRSVRLELGEDDPDSYYDRWFDHGALRREVLDPLGRGGSMAWLPTLWDADADRATRADRRDAAPGTVAVVDGPFLLRWELADAFDVSVHLQVSDAAQARRLPGDAATTSGGWRRYQEKTDPAARAMFVVRMEDPLRPALVTG